MAKTKRKVFADVKTRRLLALSADAVGGDYAASRSDDEQVGIIACISINGPLAQTDDGWFDNYESITARYLTAMSDPSVQAVILKFNSPGGDVAGLFEAVSAMRKAKTKPVVAYVDEACYSAAYALAMVADTIALPPAGGCGSVGVITCMIDVTEMNDDQGVRVEVITSGSQKADGHPDVALTDEAVARTQSRVDDLATMFFGLVAKYRGLSPDKVKSYQAGIFLGQNAVDAGLADEVMSWSDFVSATSNFGKQQLEARMASKLSAAVRDQEKAARAASSPAAEVKFKHTKKQVEVIETENDPTSSTSSTSSSDSSSDSSSAPPPKKDKGESALLELVRELTGKHTTAGITGALMALKESKTREASMAARLETIERDREHERVSALVNLGMTAGKIAPSQRAWAMSMPRATLKAYLDATPSMVHSVEDAAVEPKAATNERVVSKAMAEVWAKMGIKPEQFAACVANMDERTYAKLEKK